VSRDSRMYLEDVLRSCDRILGYVEGMDLDDFVRDSRTYDAVIRNLEIVGEAAKKLPPDIRERLPEIEWRKISGLRDFLAHAYFGIDDDILWDVVRNKVPQLAATVGKFLTD
jgi:uncharacterized protein with HEPN domain